MAKAPIWLPVGYNNPLKDLNYHGNLVPRHVTYHVAQIPVLIGKIALMMTSTEIFGDNTLVDRTVSGGSCLCRQICPSGGQNEVRRNMNEKNESTSAFVFGSFRGTISYCSPGAFPAIILPRCRERRAHRSGIGFHRFKPDAFQIESQLAIHFAPKCI